MSSGLLATARYVNNYQNKKWQYVNIGTDQLQQWPWKNMKRIAIIQHTITP